MSEDEIKDVIPKAPFTPIPEELVDILDQVDNVIDVIKENPFDKVMAKLKGIFDFNRDDKVDFQDLKEFIKIFLGVLFVVYFVIFTIEQDEILLMASTGDWSWVFIYDNIIYVGLSALGAYFFNMFKKRWIESDSVAVNYKDKSEEALKALAEVDFTHNLEIEKINHNHELELINKEIEIITKDEIAKIEMMKADIIDEIKVLFVKLKVAEAKTKLPIAKATIKLVDENGEETII